MSSRSRSRAALEIIRLSGLAVERGRNVKIPTGMPLNFPAEMASLVELEVKVRSAKRRFLTATSAKSSHRLRFGIPCQIAQ